MQDDGTLPKNPPRIIGGKNPFLRLLANLIVAIFLATQGYIFLTVPTLEKLPPLKNGDLVFETGFRGQGLPIMLTSKSLITHVGIVNIGKDGAISVMEANGSVRETPLDAWIARSFAWRLMIARIRDLPEKKAQAALDWSRAQTGKPYDMFFLPDEKAFYCSELVSDAFKKGAGITLGNISVVGDLPYVNSSPVQSLIKARWRRDPLCTEAGAKNMTFEKCRALIMKQTLITPASIARDPKLDVIYSNYF